VAAGADDLFGASGWKDLLGNALRDRAGQRDPTDRVDSG